MSSKRFGKKPRKPKEKKDKSGTQEQSSAIGKSGPPKRSHVQRTNAPRRTAG